MRNAGGWILACIYLAGMIPFIGHETSLTLDQILLTILALIAFSASLQPIRKCPESFPIVDVAIRTIPISLILTILLLITSIFS